MPELPEVETMRRGIANCVGCRIETVERPRCRLKPIAIGPSPAGLQRRAIDAVQGQGGFLTFKQNTRSRTQINESWPL